MAWREVSAVNLRKEFVALAGMNSVAVRALCRRYTISPTTGYKWLHRAASSGVEGLEDRSRRPHHSPRATPSAMQAAVVAVRRDNPAWGGRKIHYYLSARGLRDVPHPNTITGILRRHGLLDAAAGRPRPLQRFERDAPNALWQMDFKGHFPLLRGRCHALSVIDDHSRFAVGLTACGNERRETVEAALGASFRRYGLPDWMLMDNGPPWGTAAGLPHTRLTAWLMRLGIGVSHGRPFHPQTQGKTERFHRTLKAELLAGRRFADNLAAQHAFDRWRHRYNHDRPHQAIGDRPPVSRYRPATRPFPEHLAPIEYPQGLVVRRVQQDGRINFMGRPIFVSSAFGGQPIALRPGQRDGLFEVLYCDFHVKTLDLNPNETTQ